MNRQVSSAQVRLSDAPVDLDCVLVIGLPPELESTLRPRGVDSQEKFTQEEREKTALSSLYVSNDQIPDTPTEPSSQVLVEETDANVKTMIAGVEIQPFFSHATSVADLVSQLRSTGPPPNDISGMGTAMDGVMGYSTPAGGVGQGQGDGLRGLGLDPNALSLLAQHLALNGYSTAQLQQQITSGGVAPPVAAGQGFDQTQNQNQWGAYTQQPQQQQPFSDFGGFGNEERDRDERDAPRGRGTWRGRGRGRGDSHGPSGGAPGFRSRRKPCTFYAQGRRAPVSLLCCSVYEKSMLRLFSFLFFSFFLFIFSPNFMCNVICLLFCTSLFPKSFFPFLKTDANSAMRAILVTRARQRIISRI